MVLVRFQYELVSLDVNEVCLDEEQDIPNTGEKSSKSQNGQRHESAGLFRKKNIEKKHLCRHDKNYYYCWKSNIPIINLILDSRIMIRLSKHVSLYKKLDKQRESFSPNSDNFLAFFIVFEWGRILESAMDK